MNQLNKSTIASIDLRMNREEYFTALYERIFPAVAKFVRNHHGTLDDAKDLFHDALIIFYEKKTSGALVIQLTDHAYVIGIVKNLWIKRVNDQRILLSESEALIEIPDQLEITPRDASLVTFLKVAGEKCMALLQAFYYDNHSLDTIRSVFRFSSVRSATVQKFKCLEKVREAIKTKAKQYEDFVE